jgi:hypothetical protein
MRASHASPRCGRSVLPPQFALRLHLSYSPKATAIWGNLKAVFTAGRRQYLVCWRLRACHAPRNTAAPLLIQSGGDLNLQIGICSPRHLSQATALRLLFAVTIMECALPRCPHASVTASGEVGSASRAESPIPRAIPIETPGCKCRRCRFGIIPDIVRGRPVSPHSITAIGL